MPQYINTFQPRSDIGRSMSWIARAMFANQMTPNDESYAQYQQSRAATEEAQRLKLQAETQEIQRRNELSDPNNIPNLVALRTGATTPQVEQEMNFAERGYPYSRPDYSPTVAAAVRNNVAALRSLPFMTGKTNYQQFMEGNQTGADMQNVDRMLSGELDPETMAPIAAAMKGNPLYDVQNGQGFKPYGGPEDVTELPVTAALRESYNALAGQRDAQAKYTNERDRSGAGAGANKWEKITGTEANTLNGLISARAQEDGKPLSETQTQQIMSVAGNYYSSPSSPHYRDIVSSGIAAYDEAMKGAEIIDNTWPADNTVGLNQNNLSLPYPRQPSVADLFQPQGAAPGAPPAANDSTQIIQEARDAIARGAPRDAVLARLQKLGINPSGL